MVQRYELKDVSEYPYDPYNDLVKSDEGDWVRYEDFAELADAVRYLRNLCDIKDFNANTAIGALSGIMYHFKIERQ